MFARAMVIVGAGAMISGCSPVEMLTEMQQKPGASAEAAQNDDQAQVDVTPPADSVPQREVAQTGVGEKGHIEGGGYLSATTNAYFRGKESLTFSQVTHALQLYKFRVDGDGKGPQSHEEFMKEIIQANNIKLPELPPGDRYVYDVEKEQLMVEHPAK
jgi:hypothetical protein